MDSYSYYFLFPKCQTHAAVKIQHKNCLQSTLLKKIINMLFAGLGRSVLGKTVPSVLSTYLRPLAQFFPILTSRPANNIYILVKPELIELIVINSGKAYDSDSDFPKA